MNNIQATPEMLRTLAAEIGELLEGGELNAANQRGRAATANWYAGCVRDLENAVVDWLKRAYAPLIIGDLVIKNRAGRILFQSKSIDENYYSYDFANGFGQGSWRAMFESVYYLMQDNKSAIASGTLAPYFKKWRVEVMTPLDAQRRTAMSARITSNKRVIF